MVEQKSEIPQQEPTIDELYDRLESLDLRLQALRIDEKDDAGIQGEDRNETEDLVKSTRQEIEKINLKILQLELEEGVAYIKETILNKDAQDHNPLDLLLFTDLSELDNIPQDQLDKFIASLDDGSSDLRRFLENLSEYHSIKEFFRNGGLRSKQIETVLPSDALRELEQSARRAVADFLVVELLLDLNLEKKDKIYNKPAILGEVNELVDEYLEDHLDAESSPQQKNISPRIRGIIEAEVGLKLHDEKKRRAAKRADAELERKEAAREKREVAAFQYWQENKGSVESTIDYIVKTIEEKSESDESKDSQALQELQTLMVEKDYTPIDSTQISRGQTAGEVIQMHIVTLLEEPHDLAERGDAQAGEDTFDTMISDIKEMTPALFHPPESGAGEAKSEETPVRDWLHEQWEKLQDALRHT